MLIEFTKGWRQFRPGDRTDFFDSGPADLLFRKGVARPVAETGTVAPPQPAAGSAPPVAATAQRTARRK